MQSIIFQIAEFIIVEIESNKQKESFDLILNLIFSSQKNTVFIKAYTSISAGCNTLYLQRKISGIIQ